jgi:hypothetical protein
MDAVLNRSPGGTEVMTPERGAHKKARERRHLMRHPTTMPVACQSLGHPAAIASSLRDAGMGGLSFVSEGLFAQGDTVNMSFPFRQTSEQFSGIVVWSQDLAGGEAGRHAYGVRFCDPEVFRRVRLLEQICHIEAYRKVQAAQHSRQLSANQAAEEWIAKYATRFPC